MLNNKTFFLFAMSFMIFAKGGFCEMSLTIDSAFPGGNIVVERIEGDTVYLHQDLRDTTTPWFYWYFRVRGGAGRELTFQFTESRAVGVSGPGFSLDEGKTWRWLGSESAEKTSFQYTIPESADEVRFSFAMPYVEEDLLEFLSAYENHPNLVREELCQSRKGRKVEMLRLGALDKEPVHRVLMVARHHCCEMMADYVIEGVIETILSDSELGRNLRGRVQFLIVPFMDKDGVEDGDQGKNRAPHDHNRDYGDESIYPEVMALKEKVPAWSGGKLHIALDLHCPHIAGTHNELIYLVGSGIPAIWEQQQEFSTYLEKSIDGPLPYLASNNLPFGEAWNTAERRGPGISFGHWASGIPGIALSSTIEVAYANAQGKEVNPDSARLFGRDLAKAIDAYLNQLEEKEY